MYMSITLQVVWRFKHKMDQEFTSDYVDHAFQHCNSQAAASLMQG